MKTTEFMWAWNDHAPTPDRLMTRERAARLLRAWRRGTRPANYRPVMSVKRLRRGVYRVTHECGEVGTMFVGGAAWDALPVDVQRFARYAFPEYAPMAEEN